MTPKIPVALLTSTGLAAALAAGASEGPPGTYDDVVALYQEFRAFQRPKLADGVPDYTAAAMAEQWRELETYQRRLAAIDRSGWPVAQEVDYQVVRAEMSAIEFDHRVLRPWANNPAFYVTFFPEESDQPGREGPHAAGAVELWSYARPLSDRDAIEVEAGLRAIPPLLAQAKGNLTGNGRDLWLYGTKSLEQQSRDLADFAATLEAASPLRASAESARRATDELLAWLAAELVSKSGPSGIGIESYDWYLEHVQLVPYTWREEVALHQRELGRARALLAMEEIRNAHLPPLVPVASAEEYDRAHAAAVSAYLAFLGERGLLTVKPYMDPALRARTGTYRPGPREFFGEIDARDPVHMRAHGFHWFDKAWMVHEPPASPIRRDARLRNIDNTRTEGLATGWEELVMQAGMLDSRPRSRELVYILVAQRAARALGELYMHANLMSLEEAAAFACAATPRGWLRMDGELVRAEQHLYLQQPGYGTSYLIGKVEIDRLLAERRAQLGDDFRLRTFMDEFLAGGLLPVSLLHWELTGRKPPQLD